MSSIPRLQISELVARYELEPTICDIFVEGEVDCEIIARCITESGKLHQCVVYPIDLVDVSAALLRGFGLSDGNKQRLIALARDLEAQTKADSYRCIVDRDLDHWPGPLEEVRGLRWTTYCAIEGYYYTPNILRDVLCHTAKCRIADWEALYSSLGNILTEFYVFRLADRDLGLQLQWIPLERCLSRDDSAVVLDSSDYQRRLLLKNGKAHLNEQWSIRVESWRAAVVGDPRLAARGHDVLDVLAWVVQKFGGLKQFADSITIQRLFVLLTYRVAGEIALLVE